MTYHHWNKHWNRKFSWRHKESDDTKRELNSTDKNYIFKIGKKKFYRKLGKKQVNVEKPSTKDEIENFQENILRQRKIIMKMLKGSVGKWKNAKDLKNKYGKKKL